MKRITLARAGLIGQFGWLPIILVFALATFSSVAVDFETNFFPVADRFLIRESESSEFKNPVWVGDELRVYGAFRKARDCEFKSIVGYFIDKEGFATRGNVRSEDQPLNTPISRIVGKHNFGPWFVLAGAALKELSRDEAFSPVAMKFETLHDCSTPNWLRLILGERTRTILGPFPIPPLKQ